MVRSDAEIRRLGRVNGAELRELVRSLVRVLADSNRTKDLMVVEEILNRRRIAELLRDGYFADDEGRALLRERPELTTQTVDVEWLRTLPASTLGGAFARHLERHGLDLDIFDAPTPVLAGEPDLAWIVRRNRQIHDVIHTLLDLGVEGHEEVLVHAFTLGNVGFPQSFFILLFGGLKHLVLEARLADLRQRVWQAVAMGRAAGPIWAQYFEHHWEDPLEATRQRLGVAPLR